ncbi:unnamed protein product [Mytilus coruscus]|uniref:Uncharacterized protein n=1 Tax=Mytilus coruscus TaxID=42192 RepID=A0A6J8BWF4_MYTCO|nr:unnamed protein product [Mytilus coruscus]
MPGNLPSDDDMTPKNLSVQMLLFKRTIHFYFSKMRPWIILLVLVIMVTFAQGWLFKGKYRYCNCKAYDASSRELIKDFGVVSSCKGWPKCACKRAEMIKCADTCDHVVAQWVCNHKTECEARSDRIKKYYDAGGCSSGYGHESRKCGDCSTLG